MVSRRLFPGSLPWPRPCARDRRDPFACPSRAVGTNPAEDMALREGRVNRESTPKPYSRDSYRGCD